MLDGGERRMGGALMNTFVAALVLLFAAISIALIIFGAHAYRSGEEMTEMGAGKRIAAGYVLNQLRAHDESGAVRVDTIELDGEKTDLLVFSQCFDGDWAETRVFCADGALREQFVSRETPLESAQDAVSLVPLDGMEIGWVGPNLIRVDFRYPDGSTDWIFAALRSENGGEALEKPV